MFAPGTRYSLQDRSKHGKHITTGRPEVEDTFAGSGLLEKNGISTKNVTAVTIEQDIHSLPRVNVTYILLNL